MKNLKPYSLAALVCVGSAAAAQAQTPPKNDLASMDLDQLMKIQVTTASKHAQTLSDVPAAIYVITQDAIRRSGATNIPEALRGAPGVQVAQIDASKYVVSIRGMGTRYENKLLVLVDGRSVYTSLFSGVYWDAQDLDLDLVDRIEVIRGPGGTLWGSNAVNGIINIITKSSKDTLGSRLTVGTSTAQPFALAASSGFEIPNGTIRISAKGDRTAPLSTSLNTPGVDNWSDTRAGVRGDWKIGANAVSFTADGTTSREGQTAVFPSLNPPFQQVVGARYDTSDWNFQGKWERTEGAHKGASLRISFDHYDRGTSDIGERDTNMEGDFQQPIPLASRLHLIWGLSYKDEKNTIMSTSYASFGIPTVTIQTYGGFLQGEYDLSPQTRLSVGTKFEHNDYTGWETQPSARIAYKPDPINTFWVSSSRAVRTPSRADEAISLFGAAAPGQGGVTVANYFLGNPGFESEVLFAQEIGWRYQPSSSYFLDIAGFYNQYSQLRDAVYLGAVPVLAQNPYVVADSMFSNGASAVTGGLEIAAHQTVSPRWRLDQSYSLYTEDVNQGAGNVLPEAGLQQGTSPRHQVTLRSDWDLSSKFQLNLAGYYASQLQADGVEPYARVDLMGIWKASSRTEVSFGIQNLTNTEHVEAPVILYDVSSRVGRSAFLKVTTHF